MTEVILKICTIFAMILIGYAACRAKFVETEAQKHLVNLLLNVNIPCMLICSICANEISKDSMFITIETLCLSACYFLCAAFSSSAIVKVMKITDSNDTGVYKIIFTSINAGFIGFPISKMIFGDSVLYLMVIHNVILNLYLYSLCTIQLSSGTVNRKIIMKAFRNMFNPCIISAVLGIILLFMGVKLPAFLESVLSPIGDATIPMAMIIIGIQLAEGKIASCLKNIKLVVFSAVRMLIWPMAVLFAVKFLPVSELIKITLVLGAALPAASTISAIAASEGRNYKLGAEGIIVTTLMFMITAPVVILAVRIFF